MYVVSPCLVTRELFMAARCIVQGVTVNTSIARRLTARRSQICCVLRVHSFLDLLVALTTGESCGSQRLRHDHLCADNTGVKTGGGARQVDRTATPSAGPHDTVTQGQPTRLRRSSCRRVRQVLAVVLLALGGGPEESARAIVCAGSRMYSHTRAEQ